MIPNLAGPLASRFEICSELGTGGMGVVYDVLDRERGGHVALKTLVRAGPAQVHQLKHEFRALADIVHPNLVQLHELLSSLEGEPFFTMELVPGIDFLRYVRRSPRTDDKTLPISAPPLPEGATTLVTPSLRPEEPRSSNGAPSGVAVGELDVARLRQALGQLGLGLAAVHQAGKIHRDLKPSNVLVRDDGRVKILDFGLVRDASSHRSEDSPEPDVLGTPAYMSPEHAGGQALSPASDWYSVGVMLYEALTGGPPFSGRAFEIMMRKLSEDPRPPSELATDLPADLVALCMRLLERDPARRPAEVEILLALGAAPELAGPPLSAREAVTFVGREDEVAVIEQAVASARGGHPIVVYLAGRSGMGKSALAERVFARLRKDADLLLLRGRCYERESVPYKAVDSLVDALGGHLSSLPEAALDALSPPDIGALARIFPTLLRIPAIASLATSAPVVVRDEQELRWRGFAALKRLLASLGERRTLVLHIDDLQWGDVDGASLLIDLLRPPDVPRMMLLASYRSEEAERSACVRALLTAARSPGFRCDAWHVEITPLTELEAERLARALLADGATGAAGEGSDHELAASIARESEGSPFFVSELVHAARRGDRGDVSLSRLLDARVKGLPEEARRLLETVAAAGSPVPQGVVADAAAVLDPRPALALLRSRRLVRARGLSDQDAVEAYHDRIRERVLETLGPPRRIALHRGLAITLEKWGEADPERLAEHWQLAGDLERAGEFAELAAARAASALAFDRAARLYALSLERGQLTGARRCDLEIQQGDALANAGRGAEAAQAYLRAADHASPGLGLELHRRAGELLLSTGHIDDGLMTLQSVLEKLGVWLPSTPRQALASFLLRRLELRVRGAAYRERSAAQISEEDRLRIDACWALTVGLNGVDMIRGADFGARSLLLARRAGDPYRIGRALAFETTSTAFVGGRNRARAAALAAELMALATRLDNAHLRGFALLVTGMCEAFTAGRWTRALGWYARAERVFREECRGVPWEVATTDMVTSWSLFYTGRLKELAARLPSTLKAAEQRRDLYAQANLTTSMAWVMLARGDVASAREHPVKAMARWSRKAFHLQHYVALIAETHIDRYAGLGLEAWARIDHAFPALEGSLLLRAQANRIVAHYERGLTALSAAEATPRPAKLLRIAEGDARVLASERMSWAEPYVHLVRAGIAALRSDLPRAIALLERAERGFLEADMHLYAASARRRRGELEGGGQGRDLVESADSAMRAQEIEDPARWAAMLAPGFGRSG